MRELRPALNCDPQMKTDVSSTTTGQIRCAIYTRKSTDEGLDQEFNSLDAQREAAEAFILSQRGEGLVALPERYDDGGFSGGNLDRPALEQLLADIRGGAVECVVVYKVDRLSRSLIDFARIIEIFDKHNVSFVSVTQQFNTTNSLGRLTLNILLSFAQFEREIIAERTRDKVSAARRKGKWIGGRPVLGYDIDPHRSRLTINADEALQVRTIFRLYLDFNALAPVASELNRRGWSTKSWSTKQGVPQGGKPFTKGRIFRLLRNPIYSGKVGFGNQIYDGEHEAIVDVRTWQFVQQILTSNGHHGGREVRKRSGVVPTGLLRCACCDQEMVLTHCRKGTSRSRCYVCAQADRLGTAHSRMARVPEFAVMHAIAEEVRGMVADPRILARVVGQAEVQMRVAVENLTVEREFTLRALARLQLSATSDHQKRINQMQRRLEELDQELRSFRGQTLSDDVPTVLAQYWSLWHSLNGRECSRIISVLVKRVLYNRATEELDVTAYWEQLQGACAPAEMGTDKVSRKLNNVD